MQGIQSLTGAQDPKSTVSQQLIEALAAQRALNQKKEAMQQMQGEMQQQGKQIQGGLPTIAQQNEQELVSMNKQEMVQRVAPTLQRKMAEQQAAIQNAPQEARQAKQGLAALQQQQMQQRQQDMQRMANGGIVKRFSEGGLSESSPDAATLERVRNLRAKGMSEEKIAQILQQEQGEETSLGGVAGFLSRAPEIAREGTARIASGLTKPADYIQDMLVGEEYADENMGTPLYQQVYEGIAGKEYTPMEFFGDSQPAPQKSPEPEPKTSQQPQPTNPNSPLMPTDDVQGAGSVTTRDTTTSSTPPDMGGINSTLEQMNELSGKYTEGLEEPDVQDPVSYATEVYNQISGEAISPEEARQEEAKALENAKKTLKYDERMSAYDNLLETTRARYEAANDPETRRWSRITSFLKGFGGGTTLAAGFAGAGANRANQMQANKAAEEAAFNKYVEVFNDRNATEDDILKTGMAYAQNVFNTYMDERDTAISKMSSTANTKLQANEMEKNRYQKQRNAGLDAQMQGLKSQLQAQLEMAGIQSKEQLSKLTASMEGRAALLDMALKLPKVVELVDEQLLKQNPRLLRQAQRDDEEGIKARAELSTQRRALLEGYGVDAIFEILNASFQGAGMYSRVGGDLDSVDQMYQQAEQDPSIFEDLANYLGGE